MNKSLVITILSTWFLSTFGWAGVQSEATPQVSSGSADGFAEVESHMCDMVVLPTLDRTIGPGAPSAAPLADTVWVHLAYNRFDVDHSQHWWLSPTPDKAAFRYAKAMFTIPLVA